MADRPDIIEGLSPEAREGLERLLMRVGNSHEALEQSVEIAEKLADSGVLAGVNSLLDGFDDNFNAALRPEFMGMIANLMMLMGVLSELSYEPFFDLATRVPGSVNAGYSEFVGRTEPMKLSEALALMRTPEMGAAMQLMIAAMRAMRTSPPAGAA